VPYSLLLEPARLPQKAAKPVSGRLDFPGWGAFGRLFGI
jgi:hypothetical protein